MGDLITYDGANPFETQADPLISKSTDYIQAGERWGTLDTITLNGILTGTSFDNIYSDQVALMENFGKDFKTLTVDGFSDFERCKVTNVTFNESDYLSNIYKWCPSGTKCAPERKKTKWWKGK